MHKNTRQNGMRRTTGLMQRRLLSHKRVASQHGWPCNKCSVQALKETDRQKLDDTDDRAFYAEPRFVTHVDDAFIARVTQLYRDRIPSGATVLDLMSSWISHLPKDVTYARVIGHGLNAAELSRNRQLDSFYVRNLNKDPDGWSFQDSTFDAVLCCVSVQYLQYPERVFSEIHRVLKPGGVCVVTFSNRMFSSKAIAAWRSASGAGRCRLVKSYFDSAGFESVEVVASVPQLPLQIGAVESAVETAYSMFLRDPFYAVLGYKHGVGDDS